MATSAFGHGVPPPNAALKWRSTALHRAHPKKSHEMISEGKPSASPPCSRDILKLGGQNRGPVKNFAH